MSLAIYHIGKYNNIIDMITKQRKTQSSKLKVDHIKKQFVKL